VRLSYRASLDAALNAKALVFVGYAVIIAIGAYLFVRLPSELTPKEDRGIIVVNMQADEGTNFDAAKSVMSKAEGMLAPYMKSGEISRAIVVTPFGGASGFTNGLMQIFLSPWEKRHRSALDVIAELERKFSTITGATFRVNSPDPFGGDPRSAGGVAIALGGPEYGPLAEIAERAVARLQNDPRLIRPRSDYQPNSPRVMVDIDRERAAGLGVSVQAIGRALESTMGARRVNTFTKNGEEYYVYLQANREDRSEIGDITDQYVRSDTTGQLIPLGSVASFKTVGDQSERRRLNRMAAVRVAANLPTGVAMGDAVNAMESAIRAEIGDRPVTINYTGAAKTFKDASGAIFFAFGFALLIVFLVLAAQFESFIHPLVIMGTVPLAVTGGLFGLYIFGSSLNIYSQIGIIILIAIAAKNGILIVEFANQLREQGRTIREAITESAELRLRPILMTSAATAIGAVPLIFGSGAGAESRRSIGVVIVFGVLLATMLTLFVAPVFYELAARYTRAHGAAKAPAKGFDDKAPSAHPAE
jgi:multidrug efflux pump